MYSLSLTLQKYDVDSRREIDGISLGCEITQKLWLTVILLSLVWLWAKNVPPIFKSPHETHYLEVKFILFLFILYSFIILL